MMGTKNNIIINNIMETKNNKLKKKSIFQKFLEKV